VFGRELAPSTGTPHLQGFVAFSGRRRLGAVRTLLPRCHLTSARGSAQQNRAYCIKDGAYEEFGDVPTSSQGKRSDFNDLIQWLSTYQGWPTDADLRGAFPSLCGRYFRSVVSFRQTYCTYEPLAGELREWQRELSATLSSEPDPRKVLFYIDPTGNRGKSWFCKWYWLNNQQSCQILRIGKRDDLAHAICEDKHVYLFDVPREGGPHLQYTILESLKDQLVFSPKYESRTKYIKEVPHVIVFMNEEPDMNMMSLDRYEIIHI